ncbi:hypothetical protein JOQ06_010714 [Pogonophryne albipinna]|uniref:Uncharacterized protein n=1 Tax=Pogonophryne albipinna TaxID=1090488 RepID=A0AAD6FFZ8_9TELE|nr:hypothetical protein JOQ06_010714 [Pogonophryne albipinna]
MFELRAWIQFTYCRSLYQDNKTGTLEVEPRYVLIGRMSCIVVSAGLMRVGGASVLLLKGLTSALRAGGSLFWESHHCGERPERYGMTVSGTRPAFPLAPAVRAKPEKAAAEIIVCVCMAPAERPEHHGRALPDHFHKYE